MATALAIPVEIKRSETVCSLKEAVHAKQLCKFRGIAAKYLKLWKVSGLHS